MDNYEGMFVFSLDTFNKPGSVWIEITKEITFYFSLFICLFIYLIRLLTIEIPNKAGNVLIVIRNHWRNIILFQLILLVFEREPEIAGNSMLAVHVKYVIADSRSQHRIIYSFIWRNNNFSNKDRNIGIMLEYWQIQNAWYIKWP